MQDKAGSLRQVNTSPDEAEGHHSLWRRLLDFVFGYDFFISYSWSDGGGYANALTRKLRTQGFEVFLDRDDYGSGDDWKKVGAWKLRRTGQLVLVGSPAALVSAPVMREVQIFSRTGRRIVPIDFDGSLEWTTHDCALAPYLPVEILRIREPAAALKGGPSEEVVATIRRTFNLLRQDKKRVRAFAVIALVLGILAVAATWLGYVARVNEQLAQQRSRTALSRQLAADAVSQARDGRFDLGLLLSLEANRVDKTMEAKNSLLTGLNANPRLTTMLHGPSDVRGLAFASDGKTLVVANVKAITVWDLAARRPLDRSFPAEKEGFMALAISPEGKRLASSESDSQDVTLWDVAEGRRDGPPLGGQYVHVIVFSPDGTVLATAGGDQRVTFWDVVSRRPLKAPPDCQAEPIGCHSSNVSSAAFSPDGKQLVTGSWDGTIRLWDVSTGRPVGPAFGEREGGQVESVAFSPDGLLIASGGGSKAIRIWNAKTGWLVHEALAGHTNSVKALAFSNDGRVLASGSNDRTVMLWDVAAGQPLSPPLRGHTQRVASVAFSRDGSTLASGGDDGVVILWDVGQASRLGRPLPGHASGVGTLAFSPDGRKLASGGCGQERPRYHQCEGEIRLWSLAGQEPSSLALSGHAGPVSSVVFTRDGRTLKSVSCAEVGNSSCKGIELRTWDRVTGAPIGAPVSIPTLLWDSINTLAIAPGGDMLAAGGCRISCPSTNPGGEVRLWQATDAQASQEPLLGGDRGVHELAFSANAKTLAAASLEDVILWNLDSRRPLGSAFSGRTIAFRPDGALAVFDHNSRTIVLRDAASGQPLGLPFIGAPEIVLGMAFSPDGRTLAVSGSDLEARDQGSITLWDVGSRQRLSEPLSRQRKMFRTIVFSPDGKTLASSDDNAIVTLWSMSPDDWVERACFIANRNLSYAEWKQYLGDEPYRATCPGLAVDTNGMVLDGQRLARSGEIKRAVEVLAQARELDPRRKLQPDREARQLRRQSLVAQGKFFAEAGYFARGEELFREALGVDPDPPFDPRLEAGKLAAPWWIKEGQRKALAGKIQAAIAAVSDAAKLDRSSKIDSDLWGGLCRLGAVSDTPAEALAACEHALVASEPENGSYRDGRGIARARAGNRTGAIDDFNAFLAWADIRRTQRIGLSEQESLRDQIPQRQDWIRALAANADPFTPDVVRTLRRLETENYRWWQ